MYHYQPSIPQELTGHELAEKGKDFIEQKTLRALCHFLRFDLPFLKSIAEQPRYRQFFIPKGGGEKRLIETPAKVLKKLQGRIAFYLQGVYHLHKPEASYGFILSTADGSEVRNIYSNANCHTGKKWVLNLDIKNFFPSISLERVRRMFRQPPFEFSKNASLRIAQLVTFQNRLPQGAPSSPVISNLVAIPLDHKLQELARQKKWTYTRFVDDMTFSANNKFSDKEIELIKEAIRSEKFTVNEQKVRLTREKDGPEITGLILKEGKPDISNDFIKQIKEDIGLFHALTSTRMVERALFPTKAIWQFRQSIMGQINFVKMIRGEDHKSYLKLKARLNPRMR